MLNICLTRVPRFASLYFSEAFGMESLRKFKPLKRLVNEDNRLRLIADDYFLRAQETRTGNIPLPR